MTIEIKQVDRDALLMAVSDLDNLEQARKVADVVAAQNDDFDMADPVDASLWMAARNAAALAFTTQRSTYEARIAELEAERDAAIEGLKAISTGWQDRATAAEARLAEAVEVIRPFAAMGRMLDGPFAPALFRDDQSIGAGAAWRENGEPRTITFGDLRRAARFNQETERG